MRKFGLLAIVALLAVVILGSGVGTAAAEPQKNPEPRKNQILVPVTCDNRQSYTLVINGMAKTGLLIDSTAKAIKITSYTVTYYDKDGNKVYEDEFDSGTKINSRDDILDCDGQVTADFEGIGDDVTAVFDFRGFLVPG